MPWVNNELIVVDHSATSCAFEASGEFVGVNVWTHYVCTIALWVIAGRYAANFLVARRGPPAACDNQRHIKLVPYLLQGQGEHFEPMLVQRSHIGVFKRFRVVGVNKLLKGEIASQSRSKIGPCGSNVADEVTNSRRGGDWRCMGAYGVFHGNNPFEFQKWLAGGAGIVSRAAMRLPKRQGACVKGLVRAQGAQRLSLGPFTHAGLQAPSEREVKTSVECAGYPGRKSPVRRGLVYLCTTDTGICQNPGA